jgi:hypothetical protein
MNDLSKAIDKKFEALDKEILSMDFVSKRSHFMVRPDTPNAITPIRNAREANRKVNMLLESMATPQNILKDTPQNILNHTPHHMFKETPLKHFQSNLSTPLRAKQTPLKPTYESPLISCFKNLKVSEETPNKGFASFIVMNDTPIHCDSSIQSIASSTATPLNTRIKLSPTAAARLMPHRDFENTTPVVIFTPEIVQRNANAPKKSNNCFAEEYNQTSIQDLSHSDFQLTNTTENDGDSFQIDDFDTSEIDTRFKSSVCRIDRSIDAVDTLNQQATVLSIVLAYQLNIHQKK